MGGREGAARRWGVDPGSEGRGSGVWLWERALKVMGRPPILEGVVETLEFGDGGVRTVWAVPTLASASLPGGSQNFILNPLNTHLLQILA